MLLKIFKATPYHSGVGYNQRIVYYAKITAENTPLFFSVELRSYWSVILKCTSRCGPNKALLETRELIELGKYEEADAIIIVQLKEKPRDAQWRYLEAL